MSLGKKDIVKNISSKAQISSENGKKILDHFLLLISSKANRHTVKLSNFGSFYFHKSPSRIGRNPLTMQEYVINKRSKLILKTSKNIKNLIN